MVGMSSTAADRVKRAREGAGMSQRALAAASGVPQPNISAIESGRVTPRPETVERLLASAAVRPSVALRRHRDEIRAAVARTGGRNPRVFGSVARGEDSPTSDLDLLVDLGDVGLFAAAGLAVELSELLGVRVDVVDDFGDAAPLAQARLDAVPV